MVVSCCVRIEASCCDLLWRQSMHARCKARERFVWLSSRSVVLNVRSTLCVLQITVQCSLKAWVSINTVLSVKMTTNKIIIRVCEEGNFSHSSTCPQPSLSILFLLFQLASWPLISMLRIEIIRYHKIHKMISKF